MVTVPKLVDDAWRRLILSVKKIEYEKQVVRLSSVFADYWSWFPDTKAVDAIFQLWHQC